MKVVILGFYHRNNLGDELFKQVFYESLENHNLTFLNPDDIPKIPDGTDIIICGGGDIINDYFLSKIKPLVKNALSVNSKIKVYAIGVGFEYQSTICDDYLEIFDFVVTRTREITQAKLELITPIIYAPDITTSLSLPRFDLNLNFSLNLSLNTKVGVFLASPVFNYSQGIEIVKTIKNKYTPRLYSMNTHTQNAKECDIFLNNYIKYQIDYQDPFYESHNLFHNGIYVDHDFNHFSVFNEFEIAVCCRFHSVILSIMTETPFVCISPTRKVQELLKTESLGYLNVKVENSEGIRRNAEALHENSEGIRGLQSNQSGRVTPRRNEINIEALQEKLDWVVHHKKEIKSQLKEIKSNWKSFPIQLIIKNLVESGYSKRNFENISKIIKPLLKGDAKRDAKIISFFTSKSIDSEFNWGLEQQVLSPDYCLTESVKWILKHSPENYKFLSSTYPKKFNLGYFDTNCMKGLHRSGWNYVVDNVFNLESLNGIILDLYSDKTFGWESDFYKSIGKLPIDSKPWIGVFHHTPNDVYSPNNLVNCFKNELFKLSLGKCKGIITLSNYTAQWITTQLFYLKKFLIPVYNIPHPTELNVKKFSYDSMINNSNRRVIQIGAWLRDTYAIYDLPDSTHFKKSALKGKMMENYYTIPQVPVVDENCISRGVTEHKLMSGLQESLIEKHSKVEIIEHLSDNEYDELLVSNIVFLKLVDSSAVNTILECIARNTPIIVNRLPATEEYLGKDYPLFYTTLTEAGEIINDLKLIKKGTEYLSKMCKSKFTISHFLDTLISLKI